MLAQAIVKALEGPVLKKLQGLPGDASQTRLEGQGKTGNAVGRVSAPKG